MGSSSKQVTGYRYFANFLLFIGNPIEKVLGINFDKRGWQTPLIDDRDNPLAVGEVKLPNLFGENEGGVAGKIHARYGTANPQPVDFYSSYLAKNDLPPLAYPYQSCLAFKDFYLGNSGYMKEMLLWPKRTRIRNDGREQWYATSVERPWVCEIPQTHFYASESKQYISHVVRIPVHINSFGNVLPYTQSDARDYNPGSEIVLSFAYAPIFSSGGSYDDRSIEVSITFSLENVTGLHEVNAEFVARGEQVLVEPIGSWLEFSVSSEKDESTALRTVIVKGIMNAGGVLGISIHCIKPDLAMNNTWGLFYSCDYFRLSKTDGNFKTKTEAPDINPIHKIREILTDDTAMSKPESDVNDINFMKAADRIWDEGLGISWSITEKNCLEAIKEICGHIEAGERINRQTGLYEVVLFRDDWFEESEIHTIAINKIKSMSLEIANADEAINQLNVSYYNQDAIKTSSFSISENASIRNLQGRVNAEDADFPYFMNQRNAAIVAQWKLKQMSSPMWKGSFMTAEYNARKWNRYDLLKLAWPRKWQGEITVRIMKINLGTGADVSIDFVEVVPYSSQLWSDVVIDEPIDVGVQPPLACPYEPFEMPYYLAVMALGQRQVDEELSYENNFGLVGVVAQKPQSNSLYAVMMTHDGTEGEEWLRAATINYEPTAELDQIISRTSTSFVVKDSAAISGLPISTLIKCGSDWIGTPSEWMVFEGMDPYTGVVSVKRGALDSLPQEWGAGTKLYFCGNDVAFDSTEYVLGEEVLVSALTTTPSGMLENKGSIGIDMKARAFRPYPPANVKINGNYFPETHVISNDILLTWAHRNRVQQTGGEIIGWYEGGLTVENGVTYSLELSTVQEGVIYSTNGISLDRHTIPASALLQNKAHKLKLRSMREGFKSYQIFEHNFFVESVSLVLAATASKDKVMGSTVPTANISVNVDESLKANMRFDGLSISGKAEPGATITIEIKE
ncbi:phage tail protein [Acinetobacter sp. ANC 4945]|uniref:Tip attachment protein J domain-containing protein n=1 Tax=Acinetobacter amyesii TaxID=2942470 RepID=A0A1T1H6N2_9GAMM|nr:phage tail protein [Acinetobacter amyesii]MCL6246531.1 phage tail protein [Acinetobacter amyesii]OOV85504.1 hypothetical protein B1202_02355 [Acinetobacter amyesii]